MIRLTLCCYPLPTRHSFYTACTTRSLHPSRVQNSTSKPLPSPLMQLKSLNRAQSGHSTSIPQPIIHAHPMPHPTLLSCTSPHTNEIPQRVKIPMPPSSLAASGSSFTPCIFPSPLLNPVILNTNETRLPSTRVQVVCVASGILPSITSDGCTVSTVRYGTALEEVRAGQEVSL